jgi:two-component sensor histidine kinase
MLGLLIAAVVASVFLYRLSRKNRRMSDHNARLVSEQSHRVKNHLQAVQNLLSLQAIRLHDETARQAIAESQHRVQAIALLHQRLYDQPLTGAVVDLSVYLQDVVRQVLTAYGYLALQPTYHLVPLTLAPDEALPVGIILNEVLTNACKYALASTSTPILGISTAHRNGHFQLEVRDNGPGFSPAFGQSVSYGLRLVRLQTDQLRGTCHFHQDHGTTFLLTFPLRSYA